MKMNMRRFWRKPTPEIMAVIAKCSIDKGGHEAPGFRPKETDEGSVGVCIMESIALATGQEHTDMPICVSAAITGVMQSRNDKLPSNKERNKLKKLVPVIMGTAPIVAYDIDRNGKIVSVEETDDGDETYQEHEMERYAIIRKYSNRSGTLTGKLKRMSTRQFSKFIRELAAVGEEDRKAGDENGSDSN